MEHIVTGAAGKLMGAARTSTQDAREELGEGAQENHEVETHRLSHRGCSAALTCGREPTPRQLVNDSKHPYQPTPCAGHGANPLPVVTRFSLPTNP